MLYIVLYLVSVTSANLLTSAFGPSISIISAFIFIGLDLTVRDKLHDTWKHNGLGWKMTLLIASGSTIAWLINRNAGPIALASFIAFASAGLVDTVIYHWLRRRSRLIRVNGSNVVSAAIDSVVFPFLAFGFPLLWFVMIGQFAAKLFGGGFWSLLLIREKGAKGFSTSRGTIEKSL